VRNFKTNDIISTKRSLNKCVIKVSPQRAILEPDYFVQMIELADKNRNIEIQKAEAGIADDQDEKP
jgi:hypothetical protein